MTNQPTLAPFHFPLALRIFDPACGCCNFLILAYRELRRLENATVTAFHTVAGKAQQVLKVRDLVHVDVFPANDLESLVLRL